MNEILQFAHNDPWIFLFGLGIISGAVVGVVKYLAVMVRGYNPYSNETEEEEG